ncbi:MAG: septal ring lytic transglycosylase RlpA family protein [Methyloceanibacter sp.]
MRSVSERKPARCAGGHGFAAGLAAAARLVVSFALIAGLAGGIAACGGKSQKLSERVVKYGQKVPKGGGKYHVGKPYAIGSTTYQPREDPNYNRVGLASWYGDLFHGRRTANGEVYDMDRLSAAHPTLPLPTYARVTNLNNGRSIVVRVNDRGPFANDRIIDLSRRSADMLGFRQRGTAVVRVTYLGRAPLDGDDSYERRYLASQSFMQVAEGRKSRAESGRRIVSLAEEMESQGAKAWRLGTPTATPPPTPPQAAKEVPAASSGMARKGQLLIQAGMFKDPENVEKARAALGEIAPVEMTQVEFRGDILTRVRVGPFPNKKAARAALSQVTQAGYRGAKIVK